MGQVIRHGYVSKAEKDARQRFYASTAWKNARKAVLERDGHRCCNCQRSTLETGFPLDVAHRGRTLELVLAGQALDMNKLATLCRRCHGAYSSGRLGWPGDPP